MRVLCRSINNETTHAAAMMKMIRNPPQREQFECRARDNCVDSLLNLQVQCPVEPQRRSGPCSRSATREQRQRPRSGPARGGDREALVRPPRDGAPSGLTRLCGARRA